MAPHIGDIEPTPTKTGPAKNFVPQGVYMKQATNGGPVSAPEGAFHYPPYIPEGTPYTVLNQYHSKPSKLRVACIGAGATGLCLAYKMERQMVPESWELTMFDKNPDLGGTWLENTYPGVGCDIPSHLYTFSWDPNPDWSTYYASGAEIHQYFQNFADRHGSRKYMKLNTKVLEGRWDEEKGLWSLTLEDQVTKATWQDWSHVLVNGTGVFNTWKWPDIEGLHDFAGPKMHSAAWDHSVDFKGKTVGVIGTGSSSLQIVPELQKEVKDLKVFMRSGTWISPPFGGGVLESDLHQGNPDINPGMRQYAFTDADKQRFRDDPEYHLHFRRRIEAEMNSAFDVLQRGSDTNNAFRKIVTAEMERRLGPGHEELKKFFIPKWSPGCRRISPGEGYLEALVKPNVEPIFGNPGKVVPEGVIGEDGKLHKLDILVCATGFKIAFRPPFKLINGDGKTLNQDWDDQMGKNGVNLYFGLSAPRFPNYYTIGGPGAGWSSGSILPAIETSCEYSIKMMKKIQSDNIRSIAVKQEALDDIYAHFDEFHKTTVFQENCRSWFRDGKSQGRVYLWTGPTIHFLKTIKDPRFEDYNIRYRYGNRFAFLGQGDVLANKTRDVVGLSTYVRNNDDDWAIE